MFLFFLAFGIALALGLFLLFFFLSRPSRESALLAEVAGQVYPSDSEVAPPGWLDPERLAKPFGLLRKLIGGGSNAETARRLALAGYRKPYHADIFVGAKLVLPVIAGIAVAVWVKNSVIFWFLFSLASAFFLPEFWLAGAVRKRRERINLSLPDALDLLAICMEAGMGLDQAIVRVGWELQISHPDLSQELLQINLEQRAGKPRIAAWRSLANRVGLDSVRSFVNMLVQTERFGTPISKALEVFSEALRTQRRQRAEEAAAKTTIKLVLPLVFFIFPSIFVVTIAPAIITIMKSFGTVL
jgi:tight adherence protein C